MNTNTRVNRIGCVGQPDGSIDIVVPSGIAAEFQQMVRRATHTWQDQSEEMRDFADRILNRAVAMGANMKPEIYGYPDTRKALILPQVEAPSPVMEVLVAPSAQEHTTVSPPHIAKRSCCGTLLREPHHSQCVELTKRPAKCFYDGCHVVGCTKTNCNHTDDLPAKQS